MKIKHEGKIYNVSDEEYESLIRMIKQCHSIREPDETMYLYAIVGTDEHGEEYPLFLSHIFEIAD